MNDDFISAINLASFMIGMQNLRENLTQNDKAEIMNSLDKQTQDILEKMIGELEKQNEMLREILKRLDERSNNIGQ